MAENDQDEVARHDAAAALKAIERHEDECSKKYEKIFGELKQMGLNQVTMIANEARNRKLLWIILAALVGLIFKLVYAGFIGE